MRLKDLEDLAKYPFTIEAKQYIESEGIELEDIINNPRYRPIVERAFLRIKEAIDIARVSFKNDDLRLEILSFPVAILLVSIIGNDKLIRRYATAEAKRSYYFLKLEPAEKIKHIAVTTFKWNVRILAPKEKRSSIKLMIPVTVYLKYASNLSSEDWSLITQEIIDGNVILSPSKTSRLLGEAISQYIIERTVPMMNIDYSGISNYIEKIENIVKKKFTIKIGNVNLPVESADPHHPPCMRVIMSQIKSGEGPSHFARFALAAYLRGLGWSVEDVVQIFSTTSDFIEKLARYQVEHIFGLRGSRRAYSAPSCKTMKTANLCYAGDNQICAKVRHPLQYVKISMRKGENTL